MDRIKNRPVREEKREWEIIEYRTNDILPTMYLSDYNQVHHHKQFKHVVKHLQDMPHAKKMRQDMRRLARENSNIIYSDSEDDTKYKRVTNRSLLHTPTRIKKYTKKI